MTLPVALQLYTVREPLTADFEGTLQKVADIGYKHVEVAGFLGRSPTQFRQALDRVGLTPTSAHIGYPVMLDDPQAAIAQVRELGVKYMVCPWLPVELRKDYDVVAGKLADVADVAHEQGVVVAYHHHSFEFEKDAQGRVGLELMFQSTRDRRLQAELDIYWLQHGGADPVAWLREMAGRVPLLHVKDMDRTPQRGFAEVGTGTVDIRAAVAAAPAAGVQYLIVEQDSQWIDGDPLKSAAISHKNLTDILASL